MASYTPKQISRKLQRENLALAKKLKPIRINGLEVREDTPCEWCKKTKSTSLHSIWSALDPVGTIQRVCRDCIGMCAAG